MISETAKGVVAVLGAAILWGVSPILYKALAHVPALDVLSHRMIWSCVFFGFVIAIQGRLREIQTAFADKRTGFLLVIASLIIAANWAMFIWAVQVGQTTQSSLGYYIYPLISVLFGRLFFAETLSRAQGFAIGLVTVAVATLTLGVGHLPWIALFLATTFAFYGVLKKQLQLGPVISVTIEVMLVSPIAVLLLARAYLGGLSVFGGDLWTFFLLVLSGPMTAVPLILFGFGSKRMKMASVGLILYLNPTMQFASAVFLFSEPFSSWHLGAFALIWIALAIYSTSAFRQERARKSASRHDSASGTVS